jgi:hypothetical protein
VAASHDEITGVLIMKRSVPTGWIGRKKIHLELKMCGLSKCFASVSIGISPNKPADSVTAGLFTYRQS